MSKAIRLISLFILLPLLSNGQYLSLDELINLRGKDADAVNAHLSSKGWTFSGASEETEDNYSNSTWAYGRQLYTGRAKSFCKLMTADGYYSKVSYTTISKDYYTLIKNKIAAYKMVKMSSTSKDGYLVTVYVGSNYGGGPKRDDFNFIAEKGISRKTASASIRKLLLVASKFVQFHFSSRFRPLP